MIKFIHVLNFCALLFLASCGRQGTLIHDYYNSDDIERTNTRLEIVQVANKYMGIPYRDAGRTPTKGFDCSGFVSYIYDQVNIEFDGSASSMSKFGVLKDKSRLQAGDLVYFGSSVNNISHMGIIVSNSKEGLVMIHSSSSAGVSKVNLTTSTYWKSLYLFGKDIFRKQ